MGQALWNMRLALFMGKCEIFAKAFFPAK